MAKIFIDTNILIDLITARSELNIEKIDFHDLYISALSIHIVAYVLKIQVPSEIFTHITNTTTTCDLSDKVCQLSAQGPTTDFEDNAQLHSAAITDCDYFLTNDKKLLNMIYFGKTKIIEKL